MGAIALMGALARTTVVRESNSSFLRLTRTVVEPTRHTSRFALFAYRMQNLLDLSVAAVMWWSFGWGIAFGVESASGDFNQFGGPGSFFTKGGEFEDDSGYYGTEEGYSWALWLFQVQHPEIHTQLRVRVLIPDYLQSGHL